MATPNSKDLPQQERKPPTDYEEMIAFPLKSGYVFNARFNGLILQHKGDDPLVIEYYRKHCYLPFSFNITRRYIQFENGARIYLKTIRDNQDVDLIKVYEFQYLGINQALNPYQRDSMLVRVKSHIRELEPKVKDIYGNL